MDLADVALKYSKPKFVGSRRYSSNGLEDIVHSTKHNFKHALDSTYYFLTDSKFAKGISYTGIPYIITKTAEFLRDSYWFGILPQRIQIQLAKKRGAVTDWELSKYTRRSLIKGYLETGLNFVTGKAMLAVPYVGFLGYLLLGYNALGATELFVRSGIHLYTKRPVGGVIPRLAFDGYYGIDKLLKKKRTESLFSRKYALTRPTFQLAGIT